MARCCAVSTRDTLINGLQAGLQAAGVDPAVLPRKSGLPLTLWSLGRGMVTTEQGFALWRAIGELRNEECILEFTRLLSREFAPPLLIDAVFASALDIGRRGTGQPLHPLRVELKRNPAHREIYEAHYGCRVKFKAPRNAIVFRAGDLDRPFTSYNAELLAMLWWATRA